MSPDINNPASKAISPAASGFPRVSERALPVTSLSVSFADDPRSDNTAGPSSCLSVVVAVHHRVGN